MKTGVKNTLLNHSRKCVSRWGQGTDFDAHRKTKKEKAHGKKKLKTGEQDNQRRNRKLQKKSHTIVGC